MTITIKLPEHFITSTVKDLLESHWLVPRKIRHFLRTKKHLLVNHSPINWQSPVQAGDVITLLFDDEDYPQKSIPMGDSKLIDAVYEDEHLIVVNKPEGMKTHGNEPREIALLNHVSAYVGKTCYVVHRLDKETSGLVLFAKNPFVLPILNRLLEDKKIRRQYWALVDGNFKSDSLSYKDSIGRDRHDRRKRIVTSKGGQTALTHVTKLKSFKHCTLVNCQLETGRTHQIRVHLSYHGHPLIGDPLYHPNPSGRLMLHAHELTFIHPFTGKTIECSVTSQSFDHQLQSLSLL